MIALLRKNIPTRAFSLVEMLVVISIIAILAGFSLPAMNQIQSATALSSASESLVDQLKLARQQAVTRNRPVEVRLYQLPDPSDASKKVWRGLQLFIVEEDGLVAAERPVYFPAQVRMADSATYSSLLDQSRVDVTQGSGADSGVTLPGVGGNYNYRAFRFRPDGSTSLASSAFATLYPGNAPTSGSAPAQNWFAVQIDSLTGAVQTFRP